MSIEGFRPPSSELEVQGNRSEVERAGDLLATMAQEVNADLGKKMLAPDGRIKMSMFGDTLGRERVAADTAAAQEREVGYLGLDDERVRGHFLRQYGLEHLRQDPAAATEAILARHNLEQEAKHGPMTEKVATLLLHRILRQHFAVVRTAPHDDQLHGIDTVLVNRATGDVVCAFDEVAGDELTERAMAKKKKQEQAIHRGGVQLDYGFTITDGNVQKKSFSSVPVFRLAMDRDEVGSTLDELEADPASLGPAATAVAERLIESLGQQTDEYLQLERIPDHIRQQLTSYKETSLPTMRESLRQIQTPTAQAA